MTEEATEYWNEKEGKKQITIELRMVEQGSGGNQGNASHTHSK
jgi:hypothetical protein